MPPTAAAVRDGDRSLRDHLVAAAARLVAGRPAASLSVRDIAGEARVAVGVLYNHFSAKEELLALALHAHVQAVAAGLGDPPGPPGTSTLAEHLTAYVHRGLALHTAILPAFAGMLAQPGVLARFGQMPNPVGGGRGLHDELADYLRAEQRFGRVRAGADPEAVATIVVGACHEMVLPHLFSGAVEPPEVPPGYAEHLVATMLDGIAP